LGDTLTETPVNRFNCSILAALGAAALAACSPPAAPQKVAAQKAVPQPPAITLAPPPTAPNLPEVTAPTPVELGPAPSFVAPDTPAAQAINGAEFGAAAAKPAAKGTQKAATRPAAGPDPVLIRAQVLLDRARFAPGVIDGRDGDNLRQAVAAYERANQLPEDGKLDAQVWMLLTANDPAPAVVNHTLTAEDVAGPFLGTVPVGYEAQAQLPALGYADVAEALGEKFHMDPKLLKALNPGADLGAAGTVILVATPRSGDLPAVALIEVDKARRAVRAYDASGKLLALYPASVGSAERPAPDGTWAVAAVAPRPVYYYDPKRLTFGLAEAKGKLKIAAGPNNPVGSTWIDLTKDTYGIHGSPDPEIIGKRQSHGCVRLTNWDAAELGKAVKKGTKVVFLGADPATGKS
jgi:lipoprotein-anchoring transpeptidase ErfK/SrfK